MNLIDSEWFPMDKEKAFVLLMELKDWKDNREYGGYDTRLIDGAIELGKAFLAGTDYPLEK